MIVNILQDADRQPGIAAVASHQAAALVICLGVVTIF